MEQISSAELEKPQPRKVGRAKKAVSNGTTSEAEYEVEEILDSAIDAGTMQHMYLIKWKGYPSDQSTWEPKQNLLHAADLVRAFDAKKKKTASGAALLQEKKKPGRKPKAKA